MFGLIAQVGMTLVVDHSGRIHTQRKPTIKDVVVNKQAYGVSITIKKWSWWFWDVQNDWEFWMVVRNQLPIVEKSRSWNIYMYFFDIWLIRFFNLTWYLYRKIFLYNTDTYVYLVNDMKWMFCNRCYWQWFVAVGGKLGYPIEFWSGQFSCSIPKKGFFLLV